MSKTTHTAALRHPFS